MFESLLWASIGGAVGAALVWIVCRLAPRLSAPARAMLWWCVAAKFVTALVWVAPVRLPVLPAAPPQRQVVMPASVRLQWTRMELFNETTALHAFVARSGVAPTGQTPASGLAAWGRARVSATTQWFDQAVIRPLDIQISAVVGVPVGDRCGPRDDPRVPLG